MARIDIVGDIVSNDVKWAYDFFGLECTTPFLVQAKLADAEDGEIVDVYINSPGGDVTAGQQIYAELRKNHNVMIHVDGMACSAASIIAMAGVSEISPVGMLMVHRASCSTAGNMHDMKKTAETLATIDDALANAYVAKSGMSHEDAVKMMDRETWLTANQCVELGLIDGITETEGDHLQAVASIGGLAVTPEMMAQAREAISNKKAKEDRRAAILNKLAEYGERK